MLIPFRVLVIYNIITRARNLMHLESTKYACTYVLNEVEMWSKIFFLNLNTL